MRSASSMVMLFVLQTSASIFEIDLWPGEGIPVFEATSQQLQLHELPSASSRVSKALNVSVGQRISFDDTRYGTTQAGRIRAYTDSHVMGSMIGKMNHLSRDDYARGKFAPVNVEVRTGTSFEYLQYRAEGNCFVRIDGNVISVWPCPTIENSEFETIAEPKIEWWIHVVNDKAQGWLLVVDANVKEVKREF